MNSKIIKKRTKRSNWCRYDILRLIDVWAENIDKLRKVRQNGSIYKEMAKTLNDEYNVTVSVDEMRFKINNLTQRYRSEKRAIESSDVCRSEWPYYSKIYELLGNIKRHNRSVAEEISDSKETMFQRNPILRLIPPLSSQSSSSSPSKQFTMGENFEANSMNVNFNNSAVKLSEQNENSHHMRRLTQPSHVVLNEGQIGCRSSRYDSSSSLSTGGLPSNFCKVELNAPVMQQKQQQRQKQKNYQHISDSSNYSELSSSLPRSESQMTAKTRANAKESLMLSQEKNSIPVDLLSRNIPIQSTSYRNQEYTEREISVEFPTEKDNVKSHEVLKNAYSPLTINKASNDVYQSDMQSSKWDNLRSFGNFIDAELQRLDENSLAIAKMKIHKILHEASLGMYKNGEHKTDSIDDDESSVIETEDNVNIVNDDEPEAQFSNNRKRSRDSSCENKENQGPSRLSSHEQNPRNDNSNNLDSQQVNRVRKKRHKTKDILSAIYDTLKTGNMTNAESRISFGSYVSNELRAMDSETIKYAKLSICRVLFEASIGKYKKVIENDLNVNLQVQDNDVILQSDEFSKANKMELITPKMEIIDTNCEL